MISPALVPRQLMTAQKRGVRFKLSQTNTAASAANIFTNCQIVSLNHIGGAKFGSARLLAHSAPAIVICELRFVLKNTIAGMTM